MIFDSQSLRNSLSDSGSEDWPIITLESPGESKSRNNLANLHLNYFTGLFRRAGECFNPPSEGTYQNQEQSRGWAPGRWMKSPSSGDRQGSVAGVVRLTDFTSSNNILEGTSKFYLLK
jgi:hypothetical protein